jgi:cysteine-S-conjugate beta-lyase
MSLAPVAARPLEVGSLVMRRSEKWADQPAGVLASTIAEMDFELAEPVLTVLRAALDRHDLGYTPSRVPGLAAAFAGFAGRRMGWAVDPEQVVPVTDVMIGVASLCRALTEPGDAVALATPNYPPFLTELPRESLRLCQVGLRPDGALDLDALERTLTGGARVLVLTSPHNPTGRVLPRPELEAIAELCADHDTWVIADEIHAPLTLTGATFTPWLEVSDAARERGVSVTSASKAFNLAALKCALVITASGRARDVLARLGDPSDHVGLLGVLAAEAAFTGADPWLDALLTQLDANRGLLSEKLAAELPKVCWTPPQASFIAWLDCRQLGLGDDPAAAFLRHGVALSPGLAYGAPGAGFARLNFGTSPELVAEIVRRMALASLD